VTESTYCAADDGIETAPPTTHFLYEPSVCGA